jgi:2-oxoisovalerate dehydrogenase E2 component (dihydrolipoyl transacylase)
MDRHRIFEKGCFAMADVKMPQLGESVTEGTLGKWMKQVGDSVAKYEPLVEVVTDKVTAEVPSDFDGILTEILVQEGQTVSVGTIVCRVQVAGDAPAPAAAPSTHETQTTATIPAKPATQSIPTSVATPALQAAIANQQGQVGNRGRFSPAVLKIAQENNVDLSFVSGTGEGGRITRKDVLRYIESGATALPQTPVPVTETSVPQAVTRAPVQAQPAPGSAPQSSFAAPAVSNDDVTIIEPTTIRKTIARRMVESKHNAPHAWTMVEADVTELVRFRTSMKSDFKRREGVDLTYLPFVIKAVAEGLKEYPMLNAAWVNDQIHVKKNVNISIAVATDDSLVVPVIRNADRLSIAGIAHAVHDLAVRARSGRLTLDDMQGGTFTVNNTGAFGSVLSQPIINAPQAAIMTIESIVKRPVVVSDAIAIRSIVNLCLSLDHRVLDGWVSGQFLKAVKDRLATFGMGTVLY